MSELREDINRDPWGMGYRIATKRFGNTAPVAPMDPATMCNIVVSLFLDHSVRESRQLNIGEKAPPFTKAQLRMTTKELEGRKAQTGSPVSPSSYRSLCMLDCTGKVFEQLIRTRLRA